MNYCHTLGDYSFIIWSLYQWLAKVIFCFMIHFSFLSLNSL
nr:MAG TPA: hypothetical protein [Caudoviricetes sp.]